MPKSSTSWGKVAGWYNRLLEEGQDTYQEKIIKPNLLRLLNPGPRQEILDLGCGQGYFARAVAQTGAKVLGVDLAGELIRLAKAQAGGNENYLVLSAEKLSGLAGKRFDKAVCVLALQNIKNLSAAVGELARVLKPAGRAVLVLNHPAFRVPTASAWGFDPQAQVQYRRVEKYLSEITQTVDMTQGVKDPKKKKFTVSFHRPLQAYFKAFYKHGLAVARLEEWVSHKTSDRGPRKAAEDLARREIPLFLALEVEKLKN
ncbi:MAG: class I SAM-dependent methyltransferase [Patescibacteria group bacterium]|nr:class I SAM-dependent methyltransferase [Patescibacteria group bacterium]